MAYIHYFTCQQRQK